MKNRLIRINVIEKISKIINNPSNSTIQIASNSETLAAVHTHTHIMFTKLD